MSREDVLVTADWAEKNLGTEGIVFVEVDEDTTAYDGGHLPGAVKINWTTELQDPVRRDIVDKGQFEKLLSANGIGNDDTVVLYGGNNNWFAAYAYWEFRLYGHPNVKLLDGGRKKWELDGRTLTTDVVSRPSASYTAPGARPVDPRVPRRGHRLDRQEEPRRRPLARRVHRQDPRPRAPAAGAVAAARPHPDGDQHPVEQGGQRGRHVQVRRGAARALRPGGLRRGQADHRVLPHRRASARTPGSCCTSCSGQRDVKNYDGSWTEYGSLIGVPIELGAGK